MWECLSEQYEKTDTIHQLTTFHMQEGDDFETFLQSSGHITPQQNGKAERKNGTLMDATQSMLKPANLPNSFWEGAVAIACYLQNRLPTTTLTIRIMVRY